MRDLTDRGVQVAGPDTGLKRILVRVIGNMAYKDRCSQDEIRRLGAIPLVLASTQLDDKQPMAREWGLFAIRNLCEDNLENQKEIGDLKPTKVMAIPPELQKQGVSVTLDEATGKIKYSQDADSGGRVGPAHIKQLSREEERKRGVEDTQRMVSCCRHHHHALSTHSMSLFLQLSPSLPASLPPSLSLSQKLSLYLFTSFPLFHVARLSLMIGMCVIPGRGAKGNGPRRQRRHGNWPHRHYQAWLGASQVFISRRGGQSCGRG